MWKENKYSGDESSPSRKSPSSRQLTNIMNVHEGRARVSAKKSIITELDGKKGEAMRTVVEEEDSSLLEKNQEKSYNNISNGKQRTRKRQYDIRINNIDKISEQITGLLDYVKNGQYKKNKKSTDKISATPSPRRIRQLNKKKLAINSNIDESRGYSAKTPKYSITPQLQRETTPFDILAGKKSYYIEKDQSYKSKIRDEKINNFFQERNKRFTQQKIAKLYDEKTKGSKFLQEEDFGKRKHNQMLPERKLDRGYRYERNMRRQKESFMNQNEQFSQDPYADVPKKQSQSFINRTYGEVTAKRPISEIKKQQEIIERKTKYEYNYQSPVNREFMADVIETSRFNSQTDRSEQPSVAYSNIDEQISKIKERIQFSEEKTRKMEEKYLKGNNQPRQATGFLYQKNDSDNQGTRIRKKMMEATQQFNRQVQISQPQGFSIKVFPCEGVSKQRATNVIASKLAEQIKYDQKLKSCREKFIFGDKRDNKWVELQKALLKKGYSWSQSELERELAISSNEYNPFISENSKESFANLEELAQAFIESQNCWKKNLNKFISKQELQNSGFNIKEVDLDRRGYLSIQDFVCFINLYSSNFFRNRDIMMLFKRFCALGKNSSGIDYQVFLNKISYE